MHNDYHLQSGLLSWGKNHFYKDRESVPSNDIIKTSTVRLFLIFGQIVDLRDIDRNVEN